MAVNVPFFDWQGLYNERAEQFLKIIDTTLSNGRFILQKEVDDFEDSLRTITGSKYAVALSDYTTAMLLGLRASGVSEGDEVIIPSHSFIAAAQSIRHVGATPVPVELDWEDWLISPEAIEASISAKTRAIMPVHVNGRVCKMDKILKISERYGIEVFEDAAQALGASLNFKGAGTFGSWGVFSFYPSKTLGCFGDAGALITDDKKIYDAVISMRNHGAGSDKKIAKGVSLWGTNSRMDNVHAAVLLYKTSYYDEAVARRREIALRYYNALDGIENLQLPPNSLDDVSQFDVYQNFEICFPERDKLRDFLNKKKVETIIQWGGVGIHQFKELGFSQKLPMTDRFFQQSLLLPINHILSDDQIDHVIKSCLEFFINDAK